MDQSRSPERALSSLHHARHQFLQSQIAVLDLTSLSGTEAARLDFPETRAKRLSEALGRPDMELEKAMALYTAVETSFTYADQRRIELSQETTDTAAKDTERAAGTNPGVTEMIDAMDAADLPPESTIPIIRVVDRIRSEKSRSDLMLESLLISAVAQFEVFVSRMIATSLRYDPSALDVSESKYTFKDVFEHDSLDSFIDAASANYVDSLMYDGITSWMKFLARATRSNTDWVSDLLEEVVMRRNVHVHAGGKASSQYLNGLGKKAAAVKVGDDLPVTADYLVDALDRMARAVIVLTQAAVAAVCSSPRGKAAEDLEQDVGVVDATFDLLVAGRYEAVTPLAEQLGGLVEKASTRERLRANSFVAQKKKVGLGAVRAEIEAWDISSSQDEFVLAKLCLLENVDRAEKVYERLLATGRLSVVELATWPVLEPLREAMERNATKPGDES